MQETLFTPVLKKAQDAIDRVAKAHGYIYVFDTSIGSLVYINDAQSENLLPLCKADLKIPASKTKPTQYGNDAAAASAK